MFYTISYFFLLFFIYSFLGWVIETINCSLLSKKIILNRGFLIGPYIPIYGTAAVIMGLFLTEYSNNLFLLFVMAVCYSSVLEYVTSYLMEVIFHARWWDYSSEKFNLNGRICLKNCLLFGLLGVVLIYIINPVVIYFIMHIPRLLFYALSIIFALIFLSDLIITVFILSKLNYQVGNVKKDSTQEIDIEFRKLLKRYRLLYKRIFRAFPKFRYTSEYSSEILSNVRTRLEEVDKYLTEKKKEIKMRKDEIKRLRKEKEDYLKISSLKNEIKNIRKEK